MQRPLLLFLVILNFCSCQKGPDLGPGTDEFLATAAESDCGFVQNAYGQRVSWKTNIPVTLQTHNSYPPEYLDALTRAAQHWNDAAGMVLLRITPASPNIGDKAIKDAANSIHWQKEWPEANKNQQAVTHLHWRLNQLYEADLSINNKSFNFYLTKATSPLDVHLESLLVHELGHVLGLKHRSTVPSVMWAILNGAVERNILSAADRETIKCEY